MRNSGKWLLAASCGTMLAAMSSLPSQAEPVTITWQSTSLSEKQFAPLAEEMIAEFEAENPDIKIKPILVARKEDWTKFATAAQARKAPCIYRGDVTTAAYNGYLHPLDEFFEASGDDFKSVWPQDILSAVTFEGSLYALPVYAGIYAEIYNRDLVEAAGLDPESLPTTWDEYSQWMQKLTTDDQWGTAILAGPTTTTTRTLLSWIYSNGGRAFNDDYTESLFSKDPKTVEAIKFYLGLAEKGVAAPGAATINYAEQTTLFAQGKIASMRNAYWGLAKVLNDNPDLKGKLLVAWPPANTDQPRTVAKITAEMISSSCEHPEQAWKFLQHIVSPKWQTRAMLEANYMPLRTDVAEQPEIKNDPVVAKFLEIGAVAKTIPAPTPVWADVAGKDVVQALQEALLEPERLTEILQELDKTVTAKLNDL